MKDYLRRHIWILSKLYENPKGLTYKEFEYEWGRTELNSLKTPLPKRTFADCLRAIGKLSIFRFRLMLVMGTGIALLTVNGWRKTM